MDSEKEDSGAVQADRLTVYCTTEGCDRPVTVILNGEHLCAEHAYAIQSRPRWRSRVK